MHIISLQTFQITYTDSAYMYTVSLDLILNINFQNYASPCF